MFEKLWEELSKNLLVVVAAGLSATILTIVSGFWRRLTLLKRSNVPVSASGWAYHPVYMMGQSGVIKGEVTLQNSRTFLRRRNFYRVEATVNVRQPAKVGVKRKPNESAIEGIKSEPIEVDDNTLCFRNDLTVAVTINVNEDVASRLTQHFVLHNPSDLDGTIKFYSARGTYEGKFATTIKDVSEDVEFPG